MACRLSDILPHEDSVDPVITHITSDSRDVSDGTLYISTHGSEYIADVIASGAIAVVSDHFPEEAKNSDVPCFHHAVPRRCLSDAAVRLYPRQPATMVAVTGTNGKTSSAVFAQQIFAALGHQAVSIGTLGVRGAVTSNGQMTTPDAVTLHALLTDLADKGVTHAAMEASSHGLDQYRLHNVRLKAAGFTNLTRDHLDYHDTMDAYFAAKAKLFTEVLADDGAAVINADSEVAGDLIAACQARNLRVITFGKAGTDIVLLDRKPQAEGQILSLSVYGEVQDVFIPLAGIFHALNALCAAGLVLAIEGIAAWPAIATALSTLCAAPGRLQYIGRNQAGAAIYIDFAHTPDALDILLQSVRPHCQGRVHLVFGCGGDRDAGKRPLMGAIAAKLADQVIITDDNPRMEDASAIRQAVLAACPNARDIGDRRQAIEAAIDAAQDGDIVLIAGKGHEQGQIIGTTIHPFDDAVEVTHILQNQKKVSYA
ncbi:MAG: UDP-N-acetylmuramoyl-L-alanyl-D-glutamate--2,6-diaminopimelate ligase [Pseudomonadota bacterium]